MASILNNNKGQHKRPNFAKLAITSMLALFMVVVSSASSAMPNSTVYVAEWSRLRHLAAEGNPEAEFQLGNMYYLPPSHSGIPKSFEKAFEFFQKAAFKGHVTAQHNLAVLYYRGEGIKVDRAKAIAWFMIANKNGSKSAAKHLAELAPDLDSNIQDKVQLATKNIRIQIQNSQTAQ